jgi:hypothetical protein
MRAAAGPGVRVACPSVLLRCELRPLSLSLIFITRVAPHSLSLSLYLSRGGYGTLTLCVCRYPLVQVSHGMQVSLGDVRQREGCSSGCKRTPALENYIVPSVALLFEHAGLRCCVECVVLY